MDLEEIQQLIKFVAKSGVNEVELETKDFKITIKTPPRKRRGQSLLPESEEPTIIQTQVPVVQPVAQVQPMVAPPVQPATETTSPAAEEPAKETKDGDDDSKYVTIKSPMIGTFYRSSAPDKPPFVGVGDDITPGSVICIIEAMKLFNEIESEATGKIVKVLVDDATPVEYDQPLFLIDPA